MKISIFMRILVVTLLPVFIVLLIVIGTARSVIYQDSITNAKTFVTLTAKQLSEQASTKLENIAVLQYDISKEIENIDFQHPYARQTADGYLNTLILLNHDIYSAWYAFEPGVFSDNGRYFKTLMRFDDEIREINDMSNEQLSDPAASPWYNTPLNTGHVYVDISDYYDFGLGEGPIHMITMTYPIIMDDGQIIGCVGLDVLYENLFLLSSLADESQKPLLVSEEGTILYSSDGAEIDGSLWDYGFANTDEVLQAMLEKSVWQEELESPQSGERILVCLYPIDINTRQTIYLYHEMSANSLYSSFDPSTQIIIVTGVIGMILLAFCVFFTTRNIARHVKRITESFENVASGSAEDTLEGEHIPIQNTNVIELDALQDALISMIVQLRRAHEHKLKVVEAEVEKEKLIASAEAKSNFFAAMSHEIRTPMNAILGISEIMLQEGNLTPSQERYVQDVKKSSDSLLSIINDILDISRMESGKMELRADHYDFRAFMDNISSLASHLAAGTNLKFIFEMDGELPICLYGDEIRLRQILLNLIGNAIKFTSEGSVTLRVSFPEDNIRFDIIDTGEGITEGELDTIFESFKQINTRRDREAAGTGLGLSISKNLAELMDGTISVDSVYGKGSTFSVTLPLILGEKEKLRQARPSKGTQYSNSLRVLIVDDDETNLNVSYGLFKTAHGIRCDTAISGWEAISKVQQTDYDIIFMDHMMPELDGVDTTQCIRELGGKYQNVPIIALTANAVIGTRKVLIDGGMNDFLSKPIQSGKLQEILDKWVPEDKRLPEAANEQEAAPVPDTPAHGVLSDINYLLEQEGVDTLAGLQFIGYDETMYLQSLRILRDKIPQTVCLLEDLLKQQNTKEFHIHIHGLKGSLASIGAASLSDDAKKLELAISENKLDQCRSVLPPLTEKLLRLHETLSEALSDREHYTASSAFNEEQLKSILQRLCSALDRYDYEAVTVELNAVLVMEYDMERSISIQRLKLFIERFDYEKAAGLIRNEMLYYFGN